METFRFAHVSIFSVGSARIRKSHLPNTLPEIRRETHAHMYKITLALRTHTGIPYPPKKRVS